MLKTRIITALVLLIGFGIDLMYASANVFALVLGFVVSAAAWEWSRLCKVVNEHVQTGYAAAVGLFVLVCLSVTYNATVIKWLLLAGFLFWLSIPALFYLAPKRSAITKTDVPLLMLGIFVLLVGAVSIQYLRDFAPRGSSWLLLYALAVVWFMDIGAYFSGRRYGKVKLAPAISPGKTWEGVYGGLVVTTLLMLVVLLITDWVEGYRLQVVIATVLAAIASVLGDLYESRIKRAADMKDSSQILPGHGGVLDRIDGVLAAIPVFAFVWAWL